MQKALVEGTRDFKALFIAQVTDVWPLEIVGGERAKHFLQRDTIHTTAATGITPQGSFESWACVSVIHYSDMRFLSVLECLPLVPQCNARGISLCNNYYFVL